MRMRAKHEKCILKDGEEWGNKRQSAQKERCPLLSLCVFGVYDDTPIHKKAEKKMHWLVGLNHVMIDGPCLKDSNPGSQHFLRADEIG